MTATAAAILDSFYRVEDNGHDTPCWIWTRGSRAGKPILSIYGQQFGYANRLMWEQTHGVPLDGRILMRQCQASLCINPEHFRFTRRLAGLPLRKPPTLEQQRKWNLRKYGITPAEYDLLLAEQGGVCAVCHRTDSGDSLRRPLHVDHDHATGRVRGLLCTRCNSALGHAEEDPSRLRALADYLEARR